MVLVTLNRRRAAIASLLACAFLGAAALGGSVVGRWRESARQAQGYG